MFHFNNYLLDAEDPCSWNMYSSKGDEQLTTTTKATQICI